MGICNIKKKQKEIAWSYSRFVSQSDCQTSFPCLLIASNFAADGLSRQYYPYEVEMRSYLVPSFMCYIYGVCTATEPFHDARHDSTDTPNKASEPTSKSGLPSAATTLPMIRSSAISPSHDSQQNSVLSAGRNANARKGYTQVDLIGTSYVAQVTIGSQTLPLLVDTGSSDLWVAPSSFTCLDPNGREADDLANCGFPSVYNDSSQPGGQPVSDEYFTIIYGNGQFAYGPYIRENVTLGGITVPDQHVALPSRGYIRVSSGDFAGILGLAYPAMVPAREGRQPRRATDNDDPFAKHDTWLFNAIKRGLMEPMFSMALDGDGGGLLGIGGVVDVPVVGEFVSTPILAVSV